MARALRAPPRVLVVDGDPLVLDLIKRILEHEGIRVSGAGSARRALEIARAEAPSLVILDWTGQNRGELVLDELHAIQPRIRTIVASGDAEPEVKRAFAGRPVEAYLPKPFKPLTLISTVRWLLDARQ